MTADPPHSSVDPSVTARSPPKKTAIGPADLLADPTRFVPSRDEVEELLLTEKKGNCVPVCVSLPADLTTPVAAYLKLTNGAQRDVADSCATFGKDVQGVESFLLESVIGGDHQSRFSFVGANPSKVLKVCNDPTMHKFPNTKPLGTDPLVWLKEELGQYKYVNVPGIPPFTGGAIGYVSYDCVFYFEPTIGNLPPSSPVSAPDSVFMICDTVVVFDHTFQTIKIVSNLFLPPSSVPPSRDDVATAYEAAAAKIRAVYDLLNIDNVPLPEQGLIPEPSSRSSGQSNVGQGGYQGFVAALKRHISEGDIIQAVPSQRVRRHTQLHPFNAYRRLRQANPSPYMFYINCGHSMQLVGASPECLCKVSPGGLVENHAIAGTVKRGQSDHQDDELAAQLLASEKDRAEHVMLVDLARNDVNRVCKPETVNVDRFMQVEKFSHVIHLTSRVSGILRDGLTRFDAFRSIFPAGTVSGAPKLRAISLVSQLEKQRRGPYGGAVGWFNFDESAMDSCIAIRTMVFEGYTVHLQAGGGIVHDSNEEDEYEETLNKLRGNITCIDDAEDFYYALQNSLRTSA